MMAFTERDTGFLKKRRGLAFARFLDSVRPRFFPTCWTLLVGVVAALFFVQTSSAAVPVWENAVQLIEQKRYNDASVELDRRIAEHPGDSILLRLRGMASALGGRPDDAVVFFRRAVSADPQDLSARFFLARQLAENGDPAGAEKEIRRIAELDPTSEYAARSAEWLPALSQAASSRRGFDSPIAILDTEAEGDAKRWSVALRSGIKYDSNVPLRADIYPDLAPQASWGASLGGYGSYDFISPSLDHSPVRLGISASGYQLWNFEQSLADYDITGVSVRPYASWQSRAWNVPFQVSVDGSWDVIWQGGDFYNRDLTASGMVDVRLFRFLIGSVRYRFIDSEYDNDTLVPQLLSRDGAMHDVSMGLTFFAYKDIVSLGAKYGITVAETEGTQYQSVANRVEMYAGLRLPFRIDLTLMAGFQSSGYYVFTPSPGRLDNVWTAGAVLRRKLCDRLTGEFACTFVGANSSQSYTEYTRAVVDFALVYEL